MLEIAGLRLSLPDEDARRYTPILRGVDLSVGKGGAVGLVGESGCGKTMTGLAMLGLTPPGARLDGRILFEGRDLLADGGRGARDARGSGIAMVFQEPSSALNPLMRVGEQIAEAMRFHLKLGREGAWQGMLRWIGRVGLRAPEKVSGLYPHQLSGGMRQRVIIAQALCCSPALLIADEPTTALDVSLQRQVLDLLRRLRREEGTALLLISHDLALVSNEVDAMAIMYAGRVVESGPVGEVIGSPRHPYMRMLLRAMPRLEPGEILESIPGAPPRFGNLPEGCAFRDRCPEAGQECRAEPVPEVRGGRLVECWHAGR